MSRLPRIIAALVLGAFWIPAPVRGQSPAAGLALEVNRYYGEQINALVEGAVEIPFPLMTFTSKDEHLQANARVEVMIEKPDGEQVYHNERVIEPEAFNAAMASSDRVSTIETFAIYAPPGAYIARARVTDLTSKASYELESSLEIPAERPFFSDVLLSNRVQRDVQLQDGGYLPYLIGTTMFNPNPRNVFYKDSPLLYFYYEINPEALGQELASFPLEMVILDAVGETIKNLGKREIKVAEGRNFDLGAFNIGGLIPGRYTLEVRCTCPVEAKLNEDFEVRAALEQLTFLPPQQQATTDDPQTLKYYTALSPAQLDSVVEVMDVWFTGQQKQLLATLNPNGKVQFLNRFWDSLDADPSIGDPKTPENEPKVEFEQRVAYADQFFTSSQRRGRDTDRGRIYVLFGDPTERLSRPYEATLGPYEIWNYSGLGHTFAFGDFRRDGDYRLIYSTDRRFPGDPSIQGSVDQVASSTREITRPLGRGYEVIIEDILTNRTTTGFQP